MQACLCMPLAVEVIISITSLPIGVGRLQVHTFGDQP
jgi:hypothetical protein